MKKKLWLVFLIGVQLIHAQQKYVSGYIITNSNKTIEGEIEVQDESKNFNGITFKTEDSAQTFTPTDILEFGFNGSIYRSKSELNHFIKLIVEGNLSLYEGPEWFYLEKNESIYELETSEYEAEVLGEKVMVQDNKWRSTVSQLIIDCTNHSTSVVASVQLNKEAMIALVNAYNTCRKQGGTKASNLGKSYKPRTEFNFGIVSSLTNNSIEFIDATETSSQYRPSNNPSSSNENVSNTNPAIGFSIEFISPAISEDFALNTELNYTHQAYTFQSNPNQNYYEENNVNINKIAVPFSLKYTAPKYIKGAYVQIGINFDIHLDSNYSQRSETLLNNVIKTELREGSLEYSSFQDGYWAGIGYEHIFKKIKLNFGLRYSQLTSKDSTTSFYDIQSTGTSINLTLFYI